MVHKDHITAKYFTFFQKLRIIVWVDIVLCNCQFNLRRIRLIDKCILELQHFFLRFFLCPVIEHCKMRCCDLHTFSAIQIPLSDRCFEQIR